MGMIYRSSILILIFLWYDLYDYHGSQVTEQIIALKVVRKIYIHSLYYIRCTDAHTDGHMDRLTDGRTIGHADGHTSVQIHRLTDIPGRSYR